MHWLLQGAALWANGSTNTIVGALTDLGSISICFKTNEFEHTNLPSVSGYVAYVRYIFLLPCKYDQKIKRKLKKLETRIDDHEDKKYEKDQKSGEHAACGRG
jgi:hypothetical protein